MSQRPTLVLTRPEEGSARIARAVRAMLSDVKIVVSPVLTIRGTGAQVDLTRYAGVILTSQNAVPFLPDLRGVPAYVVGQRTAEASGADVRLIAEDAEDLIARIGAEGPLVHAHGQEARGDIANRLTSDGLETKSLVVYEQDPLELSAEAHAAIEGEDEVVLPLWSPRSARLVGQQLAMLGPQLHTIALSPAVSNAWQAETGGVSDICTAPNGQEMLARIVAALQGKVA